MGALPNILTLLRLAALPAVVALAGRGAAVAAAAVFLAAMLTDVADGWLARRLGATSVFGTYLDAAADKVLVVGLFYELARLGRLPFAAAHLLLARELLHSAVRDAAAVRGRVVGANWMGKAKAAAQTAVVTAGLAAPALPAGVGRAVPAAAWASVALAWVLFAEFARRNRRFLAGGHGAGAPSGVGAAGAPGAGAERTSRPQAAAGRASTATSATMSLPPECQ